MTHRISDPQANETDAVLERRLRDEAGQFPYPSTPDFVAKKPWQRPARDQYPIRARQWLWAVIVILALSCGLLAVPQVQAAIAELFHIGTITIIPATVTASPTWDNSLYPLPTPLASVMDLAGATTLDKAQAAFGAPIRLPASLGQPDKVFLQDIGGPVVILVWTDPAHPEQAKFSLHMFGPDTYAQKFSPQIIQETTVNGQRALWTQGAHLLQITDSTGIDIKLTRLVKGNVLIWTEGTITYRLEADLSLADAIKIAESLR